MTFENVLAIRQVQPHTADPVALPKLATFLR